MIKNPYEVLPDSGIEVFALGSLLVHFLIIAVIVIIAKWVDPALLSARSVSFVESAVRVDLVAMPKMTLEELKAQEPAPLPNKSEEVNQEEEVAKKPEPPSAIEDFQKEKKENKKSMKDLMKDLLLKNKKEKKVSPAGKNFGTTEIQNKLKTLVLEGNKLSKGTALTGEKTEVSANEYVTYVSIIPDLVRPNWKLPNYLMNQNLRCRVRLFLANDGDLLKTEIYESSGNPDYDQRAEAAIAAAAPFPSIPDSVKVRALRGDIVLGFPL